MTTQVETGPPAPAVGPPRGTTERVVPFRAHDGLGLTLINVRGPSAPTKGPVILVHGAGVRANIFRAPVDETIVDVLVAAGYDVWLENWRASIDVEPNRWDLDQAAAYDHPAAVQAVLADTGATSAKAVIHCQGSTSFAMSACAGLIPEVDTIVSNAVSLHPVVPRWSQLKLWGAVPVVRRYFDYLNPGWGDDAPDVKDRLLAQVVRTGHRECSCTSCKMVSFTYGAGRPALWRHENLNEETHRDFVPAEFGHVPLTFFTQMARCVRTGHLVSLGEVAGLPDDYTAQPPRTDARFALFTGELNRCFLPGSQRRTHSWLRSTGRDRDTLHVIPGYSHLDIFLGERAATNVFPQILDELAGGRTP